MTDELRKFTESHYINNARILCLTENYNNEVMWAHYAENHHGCVLGFQDIEYLDTPYKCCKKIIYTKDDPIICSGLDFLLYGDSIDQRRMIFEAILYSKNIKWEYENEWRLVTWRPEEKGCNYGDYKFYSEELESITFGVKVNDTYIKNITTILKKSYLNTKMYKMQVKHGRLSREPIHGY